MASLVIDVSKAIKRLEKINGGLADLTPFFRNISDLELSQTMLRFRAQKDPDGKRWEDSKTIRRDGAGGGGDFTREQSWNYVLASNFHAVPPGWHWFSRARGDKVLIDTATLMRSLGIAYGSDYGIVGTNLSYAEDVQEKREFLGFNQQTVRNVDRAIDSYMKGLLK